jgi:alginate O-acetyltransferase complex protein AlgI
LLLLGFFEKLVVADRIGLFVGAADAQATAVAATRVLGTYAFAFQLFADFSGLTHIAIGLGLLFGIEGPPNFNRPFAASNIQEYWRRWHMSLTTWLGDYLFTPLRMSLRNYGDAGLAVSIMINMVLIGMWHGPDATFFVFGIIHGVFMIGSTLTLRKRNAFFKTHPTCAALRRFYAPVITFNMVCLGLHFFRAPSLSTAVNRFWGSTVPSLDLMTSPSFAREIWLPALLAAVVALELGSGVLGSQRLADAINSAKQEIVRWVVYSAVLMAIFLLTPESGGAFIYAKF